MVLRDKNCSVELSFAYAMCVFCACRLPGFGYTLFKIKRRGILYSCLSHRLAFALPFPRISNALAHAVQFINDLNL